MTFGEIEVLTGRPRHEEALELLTRAAKQVQTIMKQRQWSVGQLKEFNPRNPNLLGLNVNRGQQILIRLRPSNSPGSFFDWHHILGTVLHELVHIEHSAHNAAFYELLDKLWSEAEKLMDRGVTGSGQGFDAPSVGRLGSHSFIPTHNPPEHKMADAIRKAAEARAQRQAVMPAGPHKLGGRSCSNYKDMAPAQAAAAAAVLRARDNLWCAAEHGGKELQQELGSNAAVDSSSTGGSRSTSSSGPAGNNDNVSGQQQSEQQPPAPLPTPGSLRWSATGAALPGQGQSRLTGGGPVQQQQQQHVLQQDWQQHVEQQRRQRQRQLQRLQSRKRPAADTVDLTIVSDDDEIDDAGDEAGVGDCEVGEGDSAAVSCPCCAAGAFAGSSEMAGALAMATSNGFKRWCKRHQQQRQRQQQSSWSCLVCTLVNQPQVLQCEACLTERGSSKCPVV